MDDAQQRRRSGDSGSVTQLPSGRWWARLSRVHDRRAVGTFDTEHEARAALAAALAEIARAVQLEALTVANLGKEWLDLRDASGDYRAVQRERSRWSVYVESAPLGKMLVRDVDQAAVRAWLASLKRKDRAPLAGTTRNNAIGLVRGALSAHAILASSRATRRARYDHRAARTESVTAKRGRGCATRKSRSCLRSRCRRRRA